MTPNLVARHIERVIHRDGPRGFGCKNGFFPRQNFETLAEIFGPERVLGRKNALVGAIIPEAGRVTVTVQAAPIIIGLLRIF